MNDTLESLGLELKKLIYPKNFQLCVQLHNEISVILNCLIDLNSSSTLS